MQLLLIKIGKAWNVWKRDGVLAGSRRIWKAFWALFQKVEPGDILFISNGVGDSARYRTRNVAEELRYQGLRASVTVQDNPFLFSYAAQFSVFVFHRVLYTESVARFIQALKARKKEIIFETDDLVYDPAFLVHMDHYQHMNAWEKKLYQHGLGGEILADPAVRTCTTTTTFLARKLEEKGKRVFVVQNKLSDQDVAWGEQARKQSKKEPGVVRLCYLSGTPSHDKDFATIAEVLRTLLRAYPHLRLVLMGPLSIDEAFAPFAAQIERVPFLERSAYFAAVAACDINVAPLEIGNPFCEAKSELKFFEAGLVAVPTVAAATGTFQAAITEGQDGLLARTEAEWHEKIARLIQEAPLRASLGEGARQTALMRYTTKNAGVSDYTHYVREKIV